MPLTKYLFIALIIFGFLSCKKTEEDPLLDETTGCTSCSTSTATKFYGLLKSGTYLTEKASQTSTLITSVGAYFSTVPVSFPQAASSISVEGVYFNNDTLLYSGAPLYYTNSKPILLSAETWTVTDSSGNIPPFTYNNLNDKPIYSGLTSFPDTVYTSKGFSVAIIDMQHVTAGSLYISDGGSPTPRVLTRLIYNGSDTVTFSANNLTSMQTGTNASITLFIENTTIFTKNSKDFKVGKERAYTKQVVILP